jgi:hypothetical protein
MRSNTEKKPRTNLQNPNKKLNKEIKAKKFAIAKFEKHNVEQ